MPKATPITTSAPVDSTALRAMHHEATADEAP
jgi:hypothetical protein